jgi:hypothetical protein
MAAPTVQQHPSGSTDHDPAAGGVPWTPVVRVRSMVPVIDTKPKNLQNRTAQFFFGLQ